LATSSTRPSSSTGLPSADTAVTLPPTISTPIR
jgi:hypothetical protein